MQREFHSNFYLIQLGVFTRKDRLLDLPTVSSFKETKTEPQARHEWQYSTEIFQKIAGEIIPRKHSFVVCLTSVCMYEGVSLISGILQEGQVRSQAWTEIGEVGTNSSGN